MSGIRVSLFGKFQVWRDERALTGFDPRKVQDLFCYLLLYRDHPLPRETLAGLLWGDQPTAQSKRYLRKALWQLQTALGLSKTSTAAPVLLVEPEWIRVNPEADLWLDVAEFEQVFTGVKGTPGKDIDGRQAQALERAVGLYAGDLLEGCYHDWCLFERDRFQGLYLAMLDKLMDYCEAQQDYEAGVVYGARILRYDRARERTHRRLMHLYYLAGDRTGALRQYARCVAALEEELGVKPAHRTVALCEQIRADQFPDQTPARPKVGTAREQARLLPPQLLLRLKQLHATLAHLQHEVQQDIKAVESVTDTLNGPPPNDLQ
jgi:DNA-binding SARP family transcriptional activator